MNGPVCGLNFLKVWTKVGFLEQYNFIRMQAIIKINKSAMIFICQLKSSFTHMELDIHRGNSASIKSYAKNLNALLNRNSCDLMILT